MTSPYGSSSRVRPLALAAMAGLALVGGGCASLRSVSSGHIGCSPADVTISDDRRGWGTRTWTATCHGKDWSCSAVSTGEDSGQIDCSPVHGTSTPRVASHDAAPAARRKSRTPRTTVREVGPADGTVVATQREADSTELAIVQGADQRVLRIARTSAVQVLRGCRAVRIEQGGQAVELTARYRSRPTPSREYLEGLEAKLSPAALEAIARGSSPRLRACNLEVPLSETFVRGLADSMRKQVFSRLDLGKLIMILQATPAEPTEEVWLGFSVASASHGYNQCDIVLLTNGEPVELPPFDYREVASQDRYQARVPLERVIEMVEHERTVGKVCDLRFELTDAHRGQLAEFLMRFKEERAFAGVKSETTEPEAPPAGSTTL